MRESSLYQLLVGVAALGGAGMTVYWISVAAVNYRLVAWLVLLVVVFMFLTAVAIYMRKFHEEELLKWSRLPGLREFIVFACWLGGLQRPIEKIQLGDPTKEGGDAPPKEGLRLKHAAEFRGAVSALLRAVRGCDEVIGGLMEHLSNSVDLRLRSPNKKHWPPLGVFLFAGGEGVGKKLLATTVARRLFLCPDWLPIDLRDSTEVQQSEWLFGTANTDGPLLDMLKKHPYCMVLIEQIDCAAPQIHQRLVQMLRDGFIYDSRSNSRVSLENCLVVLTTGQFVGALHALKEKTAGGASWTEKARTTLRGSAPRFARLFDLLDDVFLFAPVTPLIQAKVIASLMQRECREHDLEFRWIDPEILVEEVGQIRAEHGFDSAPTRVRILLREAIRTCKANGDTVLELRKHSLCASLATDRF